MGDPKQGITLHLLLDVEREAITDVPAIYFVQPTAAGIKRLYADCACSVRGVPRQPRRRAAALLEELAASTLERERLQVSRVVDKYLNFASVEEDFLAAAALRTSDCTTKHAGPCGRVDHRPDRTALRWW